MCCHSVRLKVPDAEATWTEKFEGAQWLAGLNPNALSQTLYTQHLLHPAAPCTPQDGPGVTSDGLNTRHLVPRCPAGSGAELGRQLFPTMGRCKPGSLSIKRPRGMPQPLQEAADSDHRGVEKLGEQQEDSHQGTGYKGLVLRVMGGSELGGRSYGHSLAEQCWVWLMGGSHQAKTSSQPSGTKAQWGQSWRAS